MVRLVSLVSPFILVTSVSAFIVFTLSMFKCPEGSMGQPASRRGRADHLAAVVDPQSLAVATGEGTEVDHHPVFK
jgi:hypothetical protein